MRQGLATHPVAILAASVLLAPGLASGQSALEWGPFRLIPTLGLTETFTDNVVLAPPGQEESDFITTIGLGLALKLRGTNYGGNLGGRVDILRYAENTDLDTTRYTAFADGRWELFGRLNLTLVEEFKRTDEFVGTVPEFTELVDHY
ncbi:MAG TPA: outer membrane beta-barrel protein, partial [Methylomirabilota bacterium]|nr:outer membrane beta-barrel protein [Methylomirabilota bacterium]